MALNLYEQIEQAAKDVRRGVQKSQNTYTIYAEAVLFDSFICDKNPEDILSEIQRQYIARLNNVGESEITFFSRLARNAILMQCLEEPQKLISRNTARELTDKWQDAEILDNLNFSNAEVRNMLQAWREFWLDDKQSGKLPENNNYGAIIERRLQATEEMPYEQQTETLVANNQPDTNPQQTQPDFKEALEVWQLWKNAEEKFGTLNIFAQTNEMQFLKMVTSCNFTQVQKTCNNIKALQFSLFKIAQAIYGRNAKEERLAYLNKCNEFLKLGDNPENWAKRSGYDSFAQYLSVFK